MAQWFEGFDGQVVLEDDYVWIVREGIPSGCFSEPTARPIRALRGDVVGTDFKSATESSFGSLRINVSAGAAATDSVVHNDVVRFSAGSNDRFSALNLLLGGNPEVVTEPMSIGDQLRAALDAFEGIASQAELADSLGEVPDVVQTHDGVIWNSVGSLWMAAGGTEGAAAAVQLERIRTLNDLTRRLPANSGIKALQKAVKGTPLHHLGAQRLGTLWEAVMSEALPDPVQSSGPSGLRSKPKPAPAASRRAATKHTARRPRTQVWNKEDSVETRDGSPRPSGARVSSPTDASNAPTTLSRVAESGPARARSTRVISALSGKRIRVYLDCDGHRVKALFDPDSKKMDVTVAPVRALLGATYPDPDAAAAAVVSAFRLGDEGPFDGWELWKVDDTSMRTLRESVSKSFE